MVALDIKQPLGLDCQDISTKYKKVVSLVKINKVEKNKV